MAQPAGVHALVRRTHEERVLRALRQHGPLSRSGIASHVGLSRTTLSEITNTLLARRAIVVVDTDGASRTGSGRPAELLALDPASGQFMGVDFGHGRVTVAVAAASHDVIAEGSVRYAAEQTWPERVQVAFELVDRLAAETGTHYGALAGIAIGLPGPHSTQYAPAGAGTEGWRRDDASEAVDAAFAERFGTPVIIDNNTRFAALAEAIDGSSEDSRDLVYVRLSDGIGGGLVVDGRLVTGARGVAGELGHVSAVRGGGQCRCGKRGCLETVASVPAILAECRARGARVETLDDLAAAVRVADPVVDAVLREAGAELGRVLGAAAMTLNPSEVVVGGEVVRVAPVLLQVVAAAITYEMSAVPEAVPVVRAASLADNDGALGAVAALFHQSPLLAGYPTAQTP